MEIYSIPKGAKGHDITGIGFDRVPGVEGIVAVVEAEMKKEFVAAIPLPAGWIASG
jgi:hypothetical protein